MKCDEARNLIDTGLAPGSHGEHAARLGFHLAGCPACRDYRRLRLQASTAPTTTPPPSIQPALPPSVSAPAPAPRSQPVAPRRPAPDLRRWLWLTSMVVLIGLPLGGVLWVAGVLFRANRNLDAMIVTPGPATLPTGEAEASALLSIVHLAPSVAPTPWPTIQPPVPTRTPRPAMPTPPPAGEAVNILLLGTDGRPQERDLPRTDAIIVLRVDPQRQRIVLLSLPRDLWVEIPNYGYNRINAAYIMGESARAPGGGMGLARETAGALLDVPIDYVAMIDFQSFIGLIDSLGGITVEVEKELYDTTFPTMDYNYTTVHFLPGPQRMDGMTALTYSRIRHPDSDFMRVRRQQAVLVGIGTSLRQRGDLRNVLTLDQITASLVGFVQTDMPKERIVGLVWALRDADPSSVEHYWVGTSMVSFGVGSDRYAMLPNPGRMRQLGRQLMGDGLP